jgi:hypothetical protein
MFIIYKIHAIFTELHGWINYAFLLFITDSWVIRAIC